MITASFPTSHTLGIAANGRPESTICVKGERR